MKKLTKDTLSEQAYLALKERISKMTPGNNKLPSEDDLADSMGVSRATVREALKRLSMDKLINTVHGKGTFTHPSVLTVGNRLDLCSDFKQMLIDNTGTFSSVVEYVGITEPSEYFSSLFPDGKKPYVIHWIYMANDMPMMYIVTELYPEYLVNDIRNKDISTLPQFSSQNMKCVIDYCIMKTALGQNPTAAEKLGVAKDRCFLYWREQLYDLEDHFVGTSTVYVHPDNMEFSIVTKFAN